MRVHPLLESFNAGEFGKRMAARVTFDKYPNAGAYYENVTCLPQGGFAERPGFRYIAGAKSNSVRPRLVPFEFSTTQAYILELGNNVMRFYRNQAQIVANDITGSITNGTFDSDITGWTDQSNGTGSIAWDSTNSDMDLAGAGSGNEAIAEQQVTGVTADVQCVAAFKVVGDPGDEIVVRVGSTSGASDYHADTKKQAGWHTISFTPTGTSFYLQFENQQNKTISIDDVSLFDDAAIEIPTPWGSSDLLNLSYAQSADVIYFCLGGATRPYRLERYGHAAWSLESVLFEDGPYLPINTGNSQMSASAATGNGLTVTATSVQGINDDKGFQSTDVGRLIRMKSGSAWAWCQIISITDTTHVKVDQKEGNLPTSGTKDWRLGDWSDDRGWPSAVGFIQQRLCMAAWTEAPQKFWMSKSADIERFADSDTAGAVQDDSAIGYQFAAKKVNTIQWVAMRKKPVIGTIGGEWTLRSEGAVLTPTDIAADFDTSTGAKKVPPIEARNRLLLVHRSGRKLLEFADVIQESGVQGFDTFDLSVLNDRVLKGGVSEADYAEEPDSHIWCVREDGQCPVLTYQPDQSVIGWVRTILGGSFQGGNAVVESVAIIPGNDGSGQFKDSTGRDEVWLAVKREVNGGTVRYIECQEKLYNGDEDLQEDAFYVDSGLTLDNPLTITNITQADPGVVTLSDASTVSNGDEIRIVRVKGMTEVNGKVFKAANKSGNDIELTDLDGVDVDTTNYTAYSADGECRKRVGTVSGLDHLEGETVGVFADGAIQTDKTVSSGSITLDFNASLVHVGLRYTKYWESLKLAYGGQKGTAVGVFKNLSDATVILMETAEGAFTLGVKDRDGENEVANLDLRDATDFDEDPVPFFTGEIELGLETGWDRDPRLFLRSTAPAPFTVLGFGPEIDTNEL